MSVNGGHIGKELIDHYLVGDGSSVTIDRLDDFEAQTPWLFVKREPSMLAYEAGEMVLATGEGLKFHNDRNSCHNGLSCCASSIRRHASQEWKRREGDIRDACSLAVSLFWPSLTMKKREAATAGSQPTA
jgi:hypothetical protein